LPRSAVHIDEQLIIDRLLDGDPQTRELVYDHYGPAVYNIILQVISDKDRAEEILTGVFLRIYNEVGSYRQSGHTSLFGWMMRLAREMALEKQQTFADTGGIAVHNAGLLHRFAGTLPAEQQRIFHFCYYKGLPKEAVARILNITPEEVGDRLKETMIAFRKFIEN
jgi:DNA-directed RNA polymerase specialized sigma24 family protein